ncbi:MAG: hypothetical protein OEX81_01035 [Candidatus Pacebacteria bacterium]|nr:hypothetical protein [Candidatus Paceibacterota bacterium]
MANAADEGDVSPMSMTAFSGMNMGLEIQNAFGTGIEDVEANELLLMGIDVDNSTSMFHGTVTKEVVIDGETIYIRAGGNVESVETGLNLVRDSLMGAKHRDDVLLMIQDINGGTMLPFTPLENVGQFVSLYTLATLYANKDSRAVEALNKVAAENGLSVSDFIERIVNRYDSELVQKFNDSASGLHLYHPTGGTPLYKHAITFWSTMIAKTQEAKESGVGVRSVSMLMSDGADEHSGGVKASDAANLSQDMLDSERHIVCGMGIELRGTDFRVVFGSMGIPDSWILTPGNSDQEIRAAFQTFSESAVSASQSGASFSQTSLGGFGE